MDWFRSHHGAPTDPKWRMIAKRAGVRPGDVAAVFWALMDYASQRDGDDRGSVVGFDSEELAAAFDFEESEITAIVQALTDKGLIVDGRLASWDKRQPKREREDTNAAERAKAWRERQKSPDNNDIDQPNASERQRTPANAEERLDTESELEQKPTTPPAPPRGDVDEDFEALWKAYGGNSARGQATNPKAPALKAYQRLRKRGLDPGLILSGATGYRAAMEESGKAGTEHYKQLVTWLNAALWEQYAASPEDDGPVTRAIRLADGRGDEDEVMELFRLRRDGMTAEAEQRASRYLERAA